MNAWMLTFVFIVSLTIVEKVWSLEIGYHLVSGAVCWLLAREVAGEGRDS